jgi:hypothetical protein
MKKGLSLLFLGLFLVSLVAAQQNRELSGVGDSIIETYSVGPERATCYGGNGQMSCLIINGGNFYDHIEGFNFEEGYRYRLSVNKTMRFNASNAPADASLYEYSLVEVLSKERIQQNRSQGNTITVPAHYTQAYQRLQFRNKTINCEDCNFSINGSQLRARLSNGRNAEVKIMPETASQKALQRLRLKVCNESNNCSIELKEVGKNNDTRLAYEVQVQRHYKLLGMFKTKAQNRVQIDAENGEVISEGKPWWRFLAKEVVED